MVTGIATAHLPAHLLPSAVEVSLGYIGSEMGLGVRTRGLGHHYSQ